MKSRKLLALFLAIFMLASLVVPASAETITPETNVTNGIVGYDAALVEKVDLTDATSISNYGKDGYTTYTKFTISSYAEWLAFDALITETYSLKDITVYLTQDIDCGTYEESVLTSKGVINPIGTITSSSSDWAPKAFAGVLDGQGYCIKNAILRPEHARQVNDGFYGLFMALSADKADTEGCVIKNFIIDSSVEYDTTKDKDGTAITPNKVAIGGLVGTIDTKYGNGVTTASACGKITISNVMNKASFTFNAGNSGGLVMFAKCCTLIMENCTNAGNMTQTATSTSVVAGEKAIGGIVGALGEFHKTSAKGYYMSVTIANCRNTGDITHASKTTVAGIVGGALTGFTESTVSEAKIGTKNRDLTISNCINNGNVTYTGAETSWACASGIFGFNKCWKTISINNCKNYGTITSTSASYVAQIQGGSQFKIDGVQPITTTGCSNSDTNSGKADPTYNMVAKYYQMSNKTYKNTEDADCYSIRLVALHNGDLALLDSYAYDITIQYGDTTVQASTGALTSVRTEIAVDSKLGEGVTKISASALGADYVSAVRIDNIPTEIGAITVTIVPTMTKGETTTTAAPITFTVDPAVYNAQ